MLRFAFHLLLYGTLALIVAGIVVSALAVWWRARGTTKGNRAGIFALAVFSVVLFLLGAKLTRRLIHDRRAEGIPTATHPTRLRSGFAARGTETPVAIQARSRYAPRSQNCFAGGGQNPTQMFLLTRRTLSARETGQELFR